MFGFDFAAIAAAAGGVGGMGPAAAVTEAMETTTATTTGATASAPTSPDIFGQAPNGVGLAANMISAVSCPNLSSNAAVSPLQIPMPMPMSAGTMTTMTPAASAAAAEVDIDPTPVAEIRAKLAAAQQQQQQQQQHNHNHQHQHQLQNQHQQGGQNRQQYRQMAAVVEAEPDPQAVTEQRQAAADQAARFPGLPPPTLLSVAVADAHQMQQRKMDGRTSASPVLAYAPVPPEEGGEPVPGGQPAAPAVAIVANPLASALCHEANNTPPSPSTTTLGVPTPLPLGPMRIPGMPPGAIHPSQAQVQQAQAQQAQAQTQTQTQAQAQAAASSAQQQLQRQQQQGSRSPQTLVGVQLQVQHAVHHHPGTSIPNLVGMSALPGAAGTRMTTTGEHGPIGGAGGGSGSILGGVQTAPTPEEQPRSVSLPDISSYAARADQEEAKRRKRLARNRASARLRRLRKKNLVDSYEGEVGVLENSLSKLRAHRWGVSGVDHEALLEALSMERGQQNIDADKRRDLMRGLLEQQREQVHSIMGCQLENMVLGWIAGNGAGGGSVGVKQEEGEKQQQSVDPEEAALSRELKDLLCLTPEQKSQIRKVTEGADEERRSLETVDSCLEAMLSNPWLMNAGAEECTEQFLSILNTGQVSKFLLWSDHNSEAIDQLDYVMAPSSSAPPGNGPMFVFGVDDGAPAGDDPSDDGKQQF